MDLTAVNFQIDKPCQMKAAPVTTFIGAPGPTFHWHVHEKTNFTSWGKKKVGFYLMWLLLLPGPAESCNVTQVLCTNW